jgi:nucleotide-binding universal stress UspA family protein
MPEMPCIVLAMDGSPLSEKAVLPALRLAKPLGAKIILLRVTEPPMITFVEGVVLPTPIDEIERAIAVEVRKQFDRLEAIAAEERVACECQHVVDARPWRGILDVAERRGAMMIVMTSHGRGDVGTLILGSQTQKVLTHSKIPVLVYR